MLSASHPVLRLPPPKSRCNDAIVAVDPGPGCGIATYHPHPAVECMNFDTMTLELGKNGHMYLRDKLQELGSMLHRTSIVEEGPDLTIMVLEKFEYRKDDSEQRERIDYTAAEYVGVAKTVAWEYSTGDYVNPYDSLVMQGASEMAFWDNDKLDRLFKPGTFGDTRHAKDAMRHLLKYMAFTRRENWLFTPLRKEIDEARRSVPNPR